MVVRTFQWPEHLLDGDQVHAPFEIVGGEGMAQPVRAKTLLARGASQLWSKLLGGAGAHIPGIGRYSRISTNDPPGAPRWGWPSSNFFSDSGESASSTE
jgi:hypothetical protein